MESIKARYYLAVILFLILLASFAFTSDMSNHFKSPEENCRSYVLQNIFLCKSAVLEIKTKENKINSYRLARKYYKRIEYFIEYYSGFDAKYFINGPLIKKFDVEYGNKIFEPHGFQVLEQIFFEKGKKEQNLLKNECDILLEELSILEERYQTISLSKSNILEMLKLQLVRIMNMNLNGYDCTINKENIKETYFVLEGVGHAVSTFNDGNFEKENSTNLLDTLIKEIHVAQTYIEKNPDSDTFDRLFYITRLLNPIYKNLTLFHLKSGIGFSKMSYAINMKKKSLFEKGGLNKQYFSLYRNDTINLEAQAKLGKLLFFDPVLSGNNKRACASCHQSSKAMTDGAEKSNGFDLKGRADRNAPTLLNVLYQKSFFYDGQVFNLEEQGSVVLHNKKEMNGDAEEIVKKLKTSDEYKKIFKSAFKGTSDTVITFYAVLKAIAEFEKTFDSFNSRFDKYLVGDYKQLSASEIKGYNLFAGKALCGSCHFFPLFNGTAPPFYNDNEFEVIGTPEKKDNKKVDLDTGREKITHSIIHRFAFKTPTVRNIALTAPYMHNGVYTTLEQVLNFYNKGGGAIFSTKLENQTLPFDSLQLTKKEMNNIKSFLFSLTDVSNAPKAPTHLPLMADVKLNKRKIGGEY